MATVAGQRLRDPRGFGWMLWIALAVAWFATMPLRPLLDPDEGRYAEIPREMAVSGDWVTPRLDGLLYFEKPPLQYWATAAAYSAFGFSEWTARLWTVGLGFLCLPLVFGWTSRLYGTSAGLAAVMALAVSPYFEIVGHLNLLDAGFTFWLAGTVLAFTLAQCAAVSSRSERLWMVLTWGAAALAVLSKGIVVGVLVGLTLIIYTLAERDARPWRRLHVALGLPLFLLAAVPWFVVVSMRNPAFAGFFFVHEHFARFLTTVHQRVEPWWYFAAILMVGALPWLALVPAASTRAWLDSGPSKQFKPLKFLVIFSAVTLVFFSLSGSKLAPYILPLMPPLAAITGTYAAQRPRFMRWAAVTSAALLLCLMLSLLTYTIRHGGGVVPHAAIGWLLAAAVGTGCALAVTWKPATPTSRPVWVVAASTMLAWQFLLCAYAEVPPERSAYKLVVAIRPLVHPNTELFSIGQYRETLSPYLERTLSLVAFTGELELGLNQEPSKRLSDSAFLARWNAVPDAIVFLDPNILSAWQQRGLQGRVIARDAYTVAVGRL
jgi:4-amino-4-deoxy-L-arabinose transferase-like glycosyltransferase